MVKGDRRVTERFGIAQERVHYILTEDLHMRKVSAYWVPRFLRADKKYTKQNMSRANLDLLRQILTSFCSGL